MGIFSDGVPGISSPGVKRGPTIGKDGKIINQTGVLDGILKGTKEGLLLVQEENRKRKEQEDKNKVESRAARLSQTKRQGFGGSSPFSNIVGPATNKSATPKTLLGL